MQVNSWPTGCCTVGVIGNLPYDQRYTSINTAFMEAQIQKIAGELPKYPYATYGRGHLVILTSQQSEAAAELIRLGWKLLASIPSGHNGHSGYEQGTFCHLYGSPAWILAGQTLPVAPPGGHL